MLERIPVHLMSRCSSSYIIVSIIISTVFINLINIIITITKMLQEMAVEVDVGQTGFFIFPNFLEMMQRSTNINKCWFVLIFHRLIINSSSLLGNMTSFVRMTRYERPLRFLTWWDISRNCEIFLHGQLFLTCWDIRRNSLSDFKLVFIISRMVTVS